MFDKLVTSGATQHRRRTSRFFVATSIIYLSALTAAFAISVVVTTPKLADSGYSSKASLIAPSAGLPPGETAPRAASAETVPREAPVEPRMLGEILESRESSSTSKQGQPGPPSIGPIEPGGGGDSESHFISQMGVTSSGPGGRDAQEGRTLSEPPKPSAPVEPQVAQRVSQKPVKLSSTVLQGKALDRHTPEYPELAKRAGVEGAVVVEVVIAESGRVESARAMSGHPLLVMPATQAARRWRFAPTLLNGQPVKVTGVITFNFKLRE
ncbi:MAG TPA: energy transducer TonB [Blastocatellia bacterium]|jgi:protein TonB